MLNHLSWQKFRKSLISVASWDARKGEKLSVLLQEDFSSSCLSWAWYVCHLEFSSTLAGNYLLQKGTVVNKKVSFRVPFLARIRSPKGTGSIGTQLWMLAWLWKVALTSRMCTQAFSIEPERWGHRAPCKASLVARPALSSSCVTGTRACLWKVFLLTS